MHCGHFAGILCLQVMQTWSLETAGTICPVTKWHKPGDLSLQWHCVTSDLLVSTFVLFWFRSVPLMFNLGAIIGILYSYMAGWLVRNKLKKTWVKVQSSNMRYNSDICLQNLHQSPGQYLILEHPTYQVGAIPTQTKDPGNQSLLKITMTTYNPNRFCSLSLSF
jgi:hypothetical protein